ncbi:leucine-rich repeat-containing protein 40-like [Armigeres subalbatus]|uniref:leucine-rich repeat-containing protein 40-like n=1 Tax=Armigeres subalbatus TaxID=124917 RepID=UPI002ED42119
MIQFIRFLSCLSFVLLCALFCTGAAPSMQVVDICAQCSCFEVDNEIIVNCKGEDSPEAPGPAKKYFNLQSTVWPVSKDPVNNQLKIRAYFRNLQLPILPRLPPSQFVRELHFSNNAINSYRDESFQQFKQLESLTLINNNLGVLEKDFFATKNILKHLDLSNNTLTSIAALERASFEQLESIYLSHNALKFISAQATRALQNASIVRLEKCDLFSWECDDDLHWKELYLSGNKLTSISGTTFSHLPLLEVLDISHNKIQFIDAQAFVFLNQLQHIDLSFNSVNSLANLHLPSTLNIVNVAGNSISQWPFGDLPEDLQRLEIQQNLLTELQLAQTVNLVALNASDNRLDSFNGDSFPLLVELDLSYNQFSELPRNLGNHLRILILDGNPYERIFFDSRVSLELLSLNRLPNLAELGSYSFWKLVSREDDKERDCVEIRISHCPKLKTINPSAFENVDLCRLDLSYNALTSISKNLIDWESLGGEINLQGNPWDCNCSQQWMVEEILPMIYETKDLQYLLEDFRCASPENRKNVRLVKYLNHHGVFCGGPQLARLVDGTQSQGTVKAGFANILCAVDDEACLHMHTGSGFYAFCVMVAVTLLVSVVLLIFIIIRRKRENRRISYESIWLIKNKKSTSL